MQHARSILAAAHVLAGAAWFGAMLYSFLILHPRARSFFRKPGQFEEFIAHISAGARWKVLGGAAFILVTGLGLVMASGVEGLSSGKWACLIAKVILFVLAVGLFCFTSWVLWPARILASAEEVPKFQRRFRFVAATLIALVGASMVLGAVSSYL